MPDREKVLKGMECCLNFGDCQKQCDYFHDNFCKRNLMRAALELMKAQEQVKPVFDEGDGKTMGQFLCGKCYAKIGFGHTHFCWYCGRAVKWDE